MIDPTVTRDLCFCSLSEKACVTLLYMYWMRRKKIFMYLTDVIQAWQSERQGCICLQCSCAVYFCDKWSCPVELSVVISSISIAGGTAESTKSYFTGILLTCFLFVFSLCSLNLTRHQNCATKTQARCHILVFSKSNKTLCVFL